jgi:Flp pilus assembly protein, protease CpaA
MFVSLTLLSVAVVMDIQSFRISNRLIVSGFVSGLFLQVLEAGVKGLGVFILNVSIPIILFYLLFLIRALGAGDIKLFSMIGGIWGFQLLIITIVLSFLVGAGISLCKLLYHRNLISRLWVFKGYICQVMLTGRILKYPKKSQEENHVIHFSIAILIGYAIAMEVAY